MRLLAVDDEPRVLSVIRRALEKEGHVVDLARTGAEAIEKVTQGGEYDGMLLDVVIPAPDGFEVCRRLRAAGHWLPILLLTGNRTAVEDRVEGLDAGADDFLAKPFSLAELQARLRAIVRRTPHDRPVVLQVGDLSLDPSTRVVMRGDTAIELTVREFVLLHYLMQRPQEAVSREEILTAVWGITFDGTSNVVDVYVRYLRDKIDRPFGRSSLQSVRGVGYRLCPDDEPPRAPS